jgi:hypothetical protein
MAKKAAGKPAAFFCLKRLLRTVMKKKNNVLIQFFFSIEANRTCHCIHDILM